MPAAGRARPQADIVAVKGDVDRAQLELDAAPLLDECPQALGDRSSAGVDPDEHDRPEILIAFDELVRHPSKRARQPFGVEQHAGRSAARGGGVGHVLLSGLAEPG